MKWVGTKKLQLRRRVCCPSFKREEPIKTTAKMDEPGRTLAEGCKSKIKNECYIHQRKEEFAMGFFFSNLHIHKTKAVSLETTVPLITELMEKCGFHSVSGHEDADLTISLLDHAGEWLSVCSDGLEFYTDEIIQELCFPLSIRLNKSFFVIFSISQTSSKASHSLWHKRMLVLLSLTITTLLISLVIFSFVPLSFLL